MRFGLEDKEVIGRLGASLSHFIVEDTMYLWD